MGIAYRIPLSVYYHTLLYAQSPASKTKFTDFHFISQFHRVGVFVGRSFHLFQYPRTLDRLGSAAALDHFPAPILQNRRNGLRKSQGFFLEFKDGFRMTGSNFFRNNHL